MLKMIEAYMLCGGKYMNSCRQWVVWQLLQKIKGKKGYLVQSKTGTPPKGKTTRNHELSFNLDTSPEEHWVCEWGRHRHILQRPRIAFFCFSLLALLLCAKQLTFLSFSLLSSKMRLIFLHLGRWEEKFNCFCHDVSS